jgi:hypothetical protein
MPKSNKRKAEDATSEGAEVASKRRSVTKDGEHAVAESSTKVADAGGDDAAAKAEERKERFKALQARAVSYSH